MRFASKVDCHVFDCIYCLGADELLILTVSIPIYPMQVQGVA